MRSNDFEKIAWCYDSLSRLVFGDRLIRAQDAFLHHVKAGSHVLIIGGGTGPIALSLLQKQPQCSVTFIDASKAMIRKSRMRLSAKSGIRFIHGTEQSIPKDRPFDAVITPFFLDMFSDVDLPPVIGEIDKGLSDAALWLVADFCHPTRWWQRALLTIMYLFFRITARIPAKRLPDWTAALARQGWSKVKAVKIDGFIEGALFKRAGAVT